MPIHPKAVYQSGRKVAAIIRRWSDDAPCDPARGVLAATDTAPSFAMTEREKGTGCYFADPVDAKGLPDDAYTVYLRDIDTGQAFDFYSVCVQGGDDTPKPPPIPTPPPVPTPAPTPPPAPPAVPPRTMLLVAGNPGDTIRFTIERLADGQFYDFQAQGFPKNPANFISPPMAQADGGPMRGIFRASLPAAPASGASPFGDGLYQVHLHRGSGSYVFAFLTLPAVASGGLLRLL